MTEVENTLSSNSKHIKFAKSCSMGMLTPSRRYLIPFVRHLSPFTDGDVAKLLSDHPDTGIEEVIRAHLSNIRATPEMQVSRPVVQDILERSDKLPNWPEGVMANANPLVRLKLKTSPYSRLDYYMGEDKLLCPH